MESAGNARNAHWDEIVLLTKMETACRQQDSSRYAKSPTGTFRPTAVCPLCGQDKSSGGPGSHGSGQQIKACWEITVLLLRRLFFFGRPRLHGLMRLSRPEMPLSFRKFQSNFLITEERSGHFSASTV